MKYLPCFKAYDVRGVVPDQIDETFAWRLGRAIPGVLGARLVAVGRDARLSSVTLQASLVRGLRESGADVIDLGLCATEEVYFATFHQGLDAGVMITASHNPANENGFKFVGRGARPIGSKLEALEEQVAKTDFVPKPATGRSYLTDDKSVFVEHMAAYWDPAATRRMKVLMDPGNGSVGPILPKLTAALPLDVTLVREKPDGTFPMGVPNPLLEQNRAFTGEKVRECGADLGIAWDGDGDRCFFFDSQGRFVDGYYIVGLLAEIQLRHYPGARIVHDPRLYWNTVERVQTHKGRPVCSRTGHAFFKEAMRANDALYGGEMSSHHYFKSFAYCDSGMIPWILLVSYLSRRDAMLEDLINNRMAAYPCSGEKNLTLSKSDEALQAVRAQYESQATKVDEIDGLGIEFENWRFNLRRSNTEPLVRLNVESRGDAALMQQKTDELIALLEQYR